MTPDDRPWSTGEAAEYLGLQPGTLAKMRAAKEGPPFAKLGRHVLYRPVDVRDWVASKLVATSTPAT